MFVVQSLIDLEKRHRDPVRILQPASHGILRRRLQPRVAGLVQTLVRIRYRRERRGDVLPEDE